MLSVNSRGSFAKTATFLQNVQKIDVRRILETQAQVGVDALKAATPTDSSLAANSWGYTIEGSRGRWRITWTNSDVETGFPVAIMLQYGYSTGTGGYVRGRNYINPALKPVFDKIAEDVWKAVKSA